MSTAAPASDASKATSEVSIPYEKYQRLLAAMEHDRAVRKKQEHVSESADAGTNRKTAVSRPRKPTTRPSTNCRT